MAEPVKSYDSVRLPSSVHTETAILGAILIDNNALLDATAHLEAEDFFLDSHRLIYRAILELVQNDRAVDDITVRDVLDRRKELDSIGGPGYIAHLSLGVPRRFNIENYVRIVKAESQKRAILNNEQIITAMIHEGEPIEAVLERQAELADDVARRQITSKFSSFHQTFVDNYASVDEFFDGSKVEGTISTGFDFDRWTNKLKPTQLIIIAARPAMGKTAWAINIATNAAIKQGHVVGIISLEMSKQQLMRRMLIAESRVASKFFDGNMLSSEQKEKAISALERLMTAPIHIDDGAISTLAQVRQKAKRLQQEAGLDLLIIDYLQLMEGPGENRTQEISKISRGLKLLAKELNVPVIALSQLSRKCEERADKRPMLSDLRESGSIEQDADIVAFIYRGEVYQPENVELRNKAEINIAKQRDGAIGTMHMIYHKDIVRFDDAVYDERYGY